MVTVAGVLAALATWLALGRCPSARPRLRDRPVPAAAPRRSPLSGPLTWGLSLAASLGVALATGWWLALGLAPVIAWAVARWLPVDTRAERDAVAAALPQALELLAACTRAGLPLRRAAEVVAAAVAGPVGEQLDRVVAAVRVGADEADAWRALADHPVLGHVARDLARATGSGTAVAASLDRHTLDARRERQAAVLERARAVGVSSVVPLMVCFLPAFLLVGVVPIVAGVLLRFLG